jgi:DNA-directed RNA polymerase specialized sigma24 family protein
VSTRSAGRPPGPQFVGAFWSADGGDRSAEEQVALVATSRRETLLRVHCFRLRREDLEDCYSQATLELVLRARRSGSFSSSQHLANALEQRFLSRVMDRRRALGGRSPMQAAIEEASGLARDGEPIEIVDRRPPVEDIVVLREDLRRIPAVARLLTDDQRLVLAAQVGQMPRADFCRRFGWSVEKYRKVGQRARARLRMLKALDEAVQRGTTRSEQEAGSRP